MSLWGMFSLLRMTARSSVSDCDFADVAHWCDGIRRWTSATHLARVISPDVFPPWWTERFGETAPLGHRLRSTLPDRWFRIHSLPDSKRYPQSEQERELLLQRQDAVAREILGPDCRLIAPVFEASSIGTNAPLDGFPRRPFKCFASYRDPGDREGFGDDDDVSFDVSFWSTRSSWNLAVERSLLLAIADDELRVLWMDAASGEIFAPYDGGVDVIASDTARRDSLKSKFSAWLSGYPGGL